MNDLLIPNHMSIFCTPVLDAYAAHISSAEQVTMSVEHLPQFAICWPNSNFVIAARADTSMPLVSTGGHD